MATFKEQKQQASQAASIAKGEATRAANIAAANQQKTTALAKGGRYEEGGAVFQTGAPKQVQGRDISLELGETLQLSDEIRTAQRVTTQKEGLKTVQTRTYDSAEPKQIRSNYSNQNIPSEFKQPKEQASFNFTKKNAMGVMYLNIAFEKKLVFFSDEQKGSTSQFAFDEGGEIIYREKQIIPREERQKVKDYIKQSGTKVFNIYDANGNLVKTTGGRNAYPDILKAVLAGGSFTPAKGNVNNFTFIPLGPTIDVNGLLGFSKGTYGPPTKPEGFGIIQKQGPTGYVKPASEFKQLGSQFASPVKNLYTTGKNIVTGGTEPTKPTILDKIIDTGSAILTPAARDLLAPEGKVFGVPGLVRKPTTEERAAVTTAGQNFLKQTKQELKSNPQQLIVPLAGEAVLFIVPPLGVSYLGGRIAARAAEELIAKAASDIRGIFAPKQMVSLKLTEKIPAISTTELKTVYHGTSVTRAMSIMKEGFKTDFPKTTNKVYGSSKKVAGFFANAKSQEAMGLEYGTSGKQPEVILKITGKQSAFEETKGNILKNIITKKDYSEYAIKPSDIVSISVEKGPSYLKGKTYFPQGGSLGKTIGGEGLMKTEIKITPVSKNVVRLEAETIKQDKLIFYDVKKKQFQTIEGVTEGEVQTSYRLKGPLSHIIKQQELQQEKFGLTQVDKDLFATTGEVKPELIAALSSKSDVLAQTGRTRIISLTEAQSNKKAVGRFLFGPEALSVKAKSDTGLIESIGSSTGGTKIPSNKLKSIIDIDVFKAFKESKLNLFTFTSKPWSTIKETFTKKLPTSSFVTDVQKNIRFGDPFSKIGKGGGIHIKINQSMLGTTKEGLGKYPTGKRPSTSIITRTKSERDIVVNKLKKDEMDILFQKPRFKEDGLITGSITGSLLTTSAGYISPKNPYGSRMIQNPNAFYRPSTTRINIKPEINTRSKITPGIITDIAPQSSITKKLKQNIFSITPPKLSNPSPGTRPQIGLNIITITTPIQTPTTTQITTPIQTQKIRQDLITPQKPLTPKIPPEEPLVKPLPFGFIPGPQSSRDYDSPSKLLGETKGFYGNVPQDAVEGIFGKRQDITYSEGFGLTTKSIRKPKKPYGLVSISPKLGSVISKQVKTRIETQKTPSFFGKLNKNKISISSKNISITSKSKGLSITSKKGAFSFGKVRKIKF